MRVISDIDEEEWAADTARSGETLKLERETVYELDVTKVTTGTNKFGEQSVCLTVGDEGNIYFNNFEAVALNRVIEDVEVPFTIQVLKTQLVSKESGKPYNWAEARLVGGDA